MSFSSRYARPITALLEKARSGNSAAVDELLHVIYGELHAMAHAKMHGERSRRTLQTTALVNEAYLRLFKEKKFSWENRAHFFASAAEAMRHVLVDQARARLRVKRGGGREAGALEEWALQVPEDGCNLSSEELLDLDAALSRLEQHEPRMGEIVKLRYFAGMTIEETAQSLGLSARSVHRDWIAAKAWLHSELSKGAEQSE